MKKIAWLFLLIILFQTIALTACKDTKTGDNTDSKTTTSTETTHDSNLDEFGYLKDNIPEDLKYNGKTVNILVTKEQSHGIFAEDYTGNVMSDEVYERNLWIEQRLDIKFNFVPSTGNWNTRNEFIQTALNAYRAGTGEYDAVACYSLLPAVLALNQALVNLYDLEFPEFDKPWWPEAILKSFMFYDTIYFVTDNSSPNLLRNMTVLHYSKNKIAEYGLENPEIYVIEGKWTLDKLKEMSAGFYQDLNNNQMVDDEDLFGVVVDEVSRLDAYFYGAGLNIIRNDDNGNPSFVYKTDQESVIRFIEKMMEVFGRKEGRIHYPESRAIYNASRTAFFTCALALVESQTETNDAFGVLPIPKFDETQERYYSSCNNGIDVWCVLADAKDPEMSGVIIEAVASGSWRKVAPAYYDEYLKYRYSDNERGVQIYDILRNGIIYDFGRLSGLSLPGIPEDLFRTPIRNNNNNFASRWASERSMYENRLEEILEIYRAGATKQ